MYKALSFYFQMFHSPAIFCKHFRAEKENTNKFNLEILSTRTKPTFLSIRIWDWWKLRKLAFVIAFRNAKQCATVNLNRFNRIFEHSASNGLRPFLKLGVWWKCDDGLAQNWHSSTTKNLNAFACRILILNWFNFTVVHWIAYTVARFINKFIKLRWY